MENVEGFVIEVRDKLSSLKCYVGGLEKEGVFELVQFKTLSEAGDFSFPSEEIATYITSVRFLEANDFETTVVPVGCSRPMENPELVFSRQMQINKFDFNCFVIEVRHKLTGNKFYVGSVINEVSEEDATVTQDIEHFFDLSEAASHPFFSEEAANEVISGYLPKLPDFEHTLVPIRFRVDSGHPFAGWSGVTKE